MKQLFFTAVSAILLANSAYADEVEMEADLDFYHGQVLFEHESCGIRYIVGAPNIDHLYINDELVAVIDYRGELGVAKGISTIGNVSLEIDGSSDPVSDYLDEVLESNGLPPYRDLSTSSCLSS